MSAQQSNSSEGTSMRPGLAYPGRYYPTDDGPRAWIVITIIFLLIAVAVIAVLIAPGATRPKAPASGAPASQRP